MHEAVPYNMAQSWVWNSQKSDKKYSLMLSKTKSHDLFFLSGCVLYLFCICVSCVCLFVCFNFFKIQKNIRNIIFRQGDFSNWTELNVHKMVVTQPTFNYSKLTVEAVEQGVKSVQS